MFGIIGCCMATFAGNEGFSSSQPPAGNDRVEMWRRGLSAYLSRVEQNKIVFNCAFAFGCIAGGMVFWPNVVKNILKFALVAGGSLFLAGRAASLYDFVIFSKNKPYIAKHT
jgi:hypothetical protein